MKYVYFVSYDFSHTSMGAGSANTEVPRDEPITTIQHIGQIESFIRRDHRGAITVRNYQLLRTEHS